VARTLGLQRWTVHLVERTRRHLPPLSSHLLRAAARHRLTAASNGSCRARGEEWRLSRNLSHLDPRGARAQPAASSAATAAGCAAQPKSRGVNRHYVRQGTLRRVWNAGVGSLDRTARRNRCALAALHRCSTRLILKRQKGLIAWGNLQSLGRTPRRRVVLL
jgi:hypothetical protein